MRVKRKVDTNHRGVARVSLRKKSRQRSVSMAVRVPHDLYEYVRRTAVSPGRRGEVVRDAITLDRDLAAKIGPDEEAMEAFAKSQSLNMDEDLAEVMARLMRLGIAVFKLKGSNDAAVSLAKIMRALDQGEAVLSLYK